MKYKFLQRLSLLCLLLLGGMAVQAQSYTDEDFSIKWSMANGAESSAVATPSEAFLTKSWGYGSMLGIDTATPTATYFGNASTRFTRVGTEKLSNSRSALDDSYVEFKFKPFAGLEVKPLTLSFDIVKVGTGDPAIWVECTQGATITSIAGGDNGVTIRKNSEDSPSEHLNYDLTEKSTITTTSGETVIRIYIGKLANNKQVALANVTITGKVNGEISKYVTVYNLATAIADRGSNIEGSSTAGLGELEPTTADANANAFKLKVDATTGGKLGANGDWAQINEGTLLTLPGVPQGATVKFDLYKDASRNTTITINGIDYTADNNVYTATKDLNLKMKCTSGGFIKTITVEGTAFVDVLDAEGYTTTWQFGKSNGADEFSLEKKPEYTYTNDDGRSLVINSSNGKLNNASREDQWAQCNNGTILKVPVYKGSKLSWHKYNGGDQTGFTIDGILYNDYYVATEDATADLVATGIGYLDYIKIEPEELFDITGTITGGTIDGAKILLTANGNKQVYVGTIAAGAFKATVPADQYALDLSEDVAYVISSPDKITVSDNGDVGTITIEMAQPQTVTGKIVNAPAEAFTLTFTGNAHNKQVDCDANATTFEVVLDPDTYTMSSSVGTLSPLSKASFKVLKEATSHNIYFPEEIPAATQQNITVDNTATVAANVYRSVSDALAAAKAGNISSPVITLTSGQTYKEQVYVDMANVTLKTSGEEKATITWYYGIGYCYYSLAANGYYDKDRANTRNSMLIVHPARWGATVLVTKNGNNFKAENIIFENSFNQRFTEEEVADGVTAHPMGDTSITYDRTLKEGDEGYKAADAKAITERAAAIGFENNPSGCQLYKCKFIGSQDTFYSSGTLYVKDSDIQGNTDYIFGGGKVVFDNCNLVIGGYSDQEASAYITAQKGNAGEAYIFRDCTVKSTDRAHILANLGRDWGGADATVYYLNLKNEIGSKLKYTWNNMNGGVTAGTANLHVYDFDPEINANYAITGKDGANINGVLSDDKALDIYANIVTFLGFTPERIYEDVLELGDNTAYNVCRIAASNNVKRNVKLTRSLTTGQWTPVVLPFALTSEQITSTFGTDTKVAGLATSDNENLNFTTASAIAANQPYLINVAADFTSANINEVTIAKAAVTQTVGDWTATGTYAAGKVLASSYYISENKAVKAADETVDVKALSAYFSNTTATDAITLNIDGVSTGINEINTITQQITSDAIYNIAGQRVSKATKGIYIIGGKKVAIK